MKSRRIRTVTILVALLMLLSSGRLVAQPVKSLDQMGGGGEQSSAQGGGVSYPGQPRAQRQAQPRPKPKSSGQKEEEEKDAQGSYSLQFHVVDDDFRMGQTDEGKYQFDVSNDQIYKGIIPGLRQTLAEQHRIPGLKKKSSLSKNKNRLTWIGLDSQSDDKPRIFVRSDDLVSYSIRESSQANSKTKQLIVEMSDAVLGSKRLRWPLDLSGFDIPLKKAYLRETTGGAELVVEYSTKANPLVETSGRYLYVGLGGQKPVEAYGSERPETKTQPPPSNQQTGTPTTDSPPTEPEVSPKPETEPPSDTDKPATASDSAKPTSKDKLSPDKKPASSAATESEPSKQKEPTVPEPKEGQASEEIEDTPPSAAAPSDKTPPDETPPKTKPSETSQSKTPQDNELGGDWDDEALRKKFQDRKRNKKTPKTSPETTGKVDAKPPASEKQKPASKSRSGSSEKTKEALEKLRKQENQPEPEEQNKDQTETKPDKRQREQIGPTDKETDRIEPEKSPTLFGESPSSDSGRNGEDSKKEDEDKEPPEESDTEANGESNDNGDEIKIF